MRVPWTRTAPEAAPEPGIIEAGEGLAGRSPGVPLRPLGHLSTRQTNTFRAFHDGSQLLLTAGRGAQTAARLRRRVSLHLSPSPLRSPALDGLAGNYWASAICGASRRFSYGQKDGSLLRQAIEPCPACAANEEARVSREPSIVQLVDGFSGGRTAATREIQRWATAPTGC